MFTCIGNKIKCVNIKSDGFILDHCLIQTQLTLIQNSHSTIQKVFRNFKDLDFEKFWSDANLDELSKPLEDCENTNIEEFLITCNDSITHLLDKHAPFRMFKRKVRPKRLWYNKDLQTQRCIVRNRERLWRKYLQDYLWLSFKIERNRYNKMLKEAKEAFISADIV